MHSPIRRQLTLVVICTNLLGLGIVYATFELYERASFRRTLTGELSVLADTVAANSHVPLAFHEQEWAQDVLEELGAERRIVAAYLYTLDGQVLAQYRRSGTSPDFHVSYSESGGAQFTPDSLILRRTIFFKGKQLGSIAIVSDPTELQTKMRGYNEISALALLLSVFATLFISSRMLRLITEPILQLAEVAGKVSSEENYALRAIPQSNDEVGKLIQSFNGMLAKIQERDSKLKEINDDLELRVDARTQELQLEVEERVRAQETLSAERQVLRALIDNVPDHMYVKDTECRFLLANVSVARQMGAKTPEELIGKTDFDYYPRGLATTFFEDEQRVITRFSLGDARDRSETLRILVAEDNLVNQRLVVRLLEKRGHCVVVAANGKDALEALERETFDIILMDVQMPEMDGFEATAAIREKEKSSGLHQIIVALTAHAMKGDREKCLGAGMDGYLSKPIRPQGLDEVLARYAARHQVTA